LLEGTDSALAPANSSPSSVAEHDLASSLGPDPIRAPVWTVQVVPQAAMLYGRPRHQTGWHQAPLAGDGRVR
jgi:hypothetical protein